MMRSTKRFDVLRWLCLVMTLFGLVVILTWHSLPLTQLESWLLDVRNTSAWDSYHAASRDAPDYADQFLLLAEDLAYVQKNDALDELKRRVLAALTAKLLEENRIVEALAWSDRWVEFDARSVNALVFHAYINSFLPEHRDESDRQFSQLQNRFPEQVSIAAMHAQALWALGSKLEAFRVIRPYLIVDEHQSLIPVPGEADTSPWWVEQHSIKGMTEQRTVRPVLRDGSWELNLHITDSTSRVVLMCQHNRALSVAKLTLTDTKATWPPSHANGQLVNGRYLKDVGESLEFSWDNPVSGQIKFTAEVRITLPRVSMMIAADPELRDEIKRLADPRDLEALSRFDQWRMAVTNG